ncbi:unnamed protein product [Phytophthora lilii]|uniref:Unnamed protein product n=1 Tax=Phytophthora lilii TaxID=2077276 RepID=A0A9W6U6M5_9STRA|nr:unnamed protein product [Phytophthora lilii]
MDTAAFKAFIPDFDERVAKANKLKPIAEELGVTLAELALAWCVTNENVSTVLIGARNLAQFEQNLKALPVVDKITPEIKAKIDALVPIAPSAHWEPASRRGKFL